MHIQYHVFLVATPQACSPTPVGSLFFILDTVLMS